MKKKLLVVLISCMCLNAYAQTITPAIPSTTSNVSEVYEIQINNNWSFSGFVEFEKDTARISVKYIPSDMIGSLQQSAITTSGKDSYIQFNLKDIIKNDVENLTIEINLPPDYFKTQIIELNQNKKIAGTGINAFYGNYDVNFSDFSLKDTKAAFSANYSSSKNWVVKNNFLWDGRNVSRLNSVWEKQHKNNSMLRVGDVQSSALNGFNSIEVGGVRYSTSYFNGSQFSDDYLRLLPISGYAITPSKLDLYINNQLTQQTEVAAGRYNLNVPFQTSGIGEAKAFIYDVTGKPIIVSVPFYNNAELIRKGRLEYDVSAGLARKDVGYKNFSYSMPIIQGIAKYGVSDNYTQDFYIQSSNEYSAASLYSHWVPNTKLGLIHAGISANSDKQLLYRLGFERLTPDFSAGIDIQKSSEFCFGYNRACLKNQLVLFGGAPLPYNMGSLTMNYVKRENTDENNKIVSASWNKQIAKRFSTFVSLSQSKGTTNNKSIYFGLAFNLGPRISSSSSINHDDGRLGLQQSFSVSEDSDKPHRGFGSFTVNKNESDTSANIYYGARLNKFQYQTNIYKNNEGVTSNINVSGGVAYIPSEKYIGFSRPFNNGLAFINVQNATEEVSILHENKFAGTTDKKGRMLINDVIPLNREKVEIDINKMNTKTTVEEYKKEFDVPFSGAVRVDFKAKSLPYIITIKGAPSGSIFNIGDDSYVVGADGEAAVESSGDAVVPISEGKTCKINIQPTQKEYVCK